MFSPFHDREKLFDIDTYRDLPADTMLIDVYDRVVGTPEEQEYSETVIYLKNSETARLVCYTGDSEGNRVTHERLVSLGAVQAVLDVLREHRMDAWNSLRDADALCGVIHVVKFPDGKGGYIRVSSEHMPRDGEKAFCAVRAVVNSLPTIE